MRFRKKPVVIEARQFTIESGPSVAEWVDGSELISDPMMRAAYLEIPTLEGKMTAILGDWIICGVKGEFYPRKPDIFDATYEPVDDPEAGEWSNRV